MVSKLLQETRAMYYAKPRFPSALLRTRMKTAVATRSWYVAIALIIVPNNTGSDYICYELYYHVLQRHCEDERDRSLRGSSSSNPTIWALLAQKHPKTRCSTQTSSQQVNANLKLTEVRAPKVPAHPFQLIAYKLALGRAMAWLRNQIRNR